MTRVVLVPVVLLLMAVITAAKDLSFKTRKYSTVCTSSNNWYNGKCSDHRLSCGDNGRIIVTDGHVGFLAKSSECTQLNVCQNQQRCCNHYSSSVCRESLTGTELVKVACSCSGKRYCQVDSSGCLSANGSTCSSDLYQSNGYMSIMTYACVPDDAILVTPTNNTVSRELRTASLFLEKSIKQQARRNGTWRISTFSKASTVHLYSLTMIGAKNGYHSYSSYSSWNVTIKDAVGKVIVVKPFNSASYGSYDANPSWNKMQPRFMDTLTLPVTVNVQSSSYFPDLIWLLFEANTGTIVVDYKGKCFYDTIYNTYGLSCEWKNRGSDAPTQDDNLTGALDSNDDGKVDTTRYSTVCTNTDNWYHGKCSDHRLSCGDNGRIIVTDGHVGFLAKSSECTRLDVCQNQERCCNHNNRAMCRESLLESKLNKVASSCSGKHYCQADAQSCILSNGSACSSGLYQSSAHTSILSYTCVPDESIFQTPSSNMASQAVRLATLFLENSIADRDTHKGTWRILSSSQASKVRMYSLAIMGTQNGYSYYYSRWNVTIRDNAGKVITFKAFHSSNGYNTHRYDETSRWDDLLPHYMDELVLPVTVTVQSSDSFPDLIWLGFEANAGTIVVEYKGDCLYSAADDSNPYGLTCAWKNWGDGVDSHGDSGSPGDRLVDNKDDHRGKDGKTGKRDGDDAGDATGIVVGAVIAAIVVVAVITVGVFLLYRRRSQKEMGGDWRSTSGLNNDSGYADPGYTMPNMVTPPYGFNGGDSGNKQPLGEVRTSFPYPKAGKQKHNMKGKRTDSGNSHNSEEAESGIEDSSDHDDFAPVYHNARNEDDPVYLELDGEYGNKPAPTAPCPVVRGPLPLPPLPSGQHYASAEVPTVCRQIEHRQQPEAVHGPGQGYELAGQPADERPSVSLSGQHAPHSTQEQPATGGPPNTMRSTSPKDNNYDNTFTKRSAQSQVTANNYDHLKPGYHVPIGQTQPARYTRLSHMGLHSDAC